LLSGSARGECARRAFLLDGLRDRHRNLGYHNIAVMILLTGELHFDHVVTLRVAAAIGLGLFAWAGLFLLRLLPARTSCGAPTSLSQLRNSI
jgi:hypothetical protein